MSIGERDGLVALSKNSSPCTLPPQIEQDSWFIAGDDPSGSEACLAASHPFVRVQTPGRRGSVRLRHFRGSMVVSLLFHAAAMAAAAQATARFRHWELRLPTGRNSVALAASMSSPRNDAPAEVRVELPEMDVAEPAVSRRPAEVPDVAASQLASAPAAERLMPPPANVERNRAVEQPGPVDLPESVPPKRTADARVPPRETKLQVESVASAPSSESAGVQSSLPPTEVVSVTPVYPPAALAASLEGVVKLYVRLNEKGEVVEADVYQSSGHALLDQAALDVIYGWRFTSPDAAAGIATEFIKPIPFRIVRGKSR